MPALEWCKVRPSATFIHQFSLPNGVLAISGLDDWYLCNPCSDPVSDGRRLLGSTPATQWYQVPAEALIPHRPIWFQKGGGHWGGVAWAGEARLRLGSEFASLLEQEKLFYSQFTSLTDWNLMWPGWPRSERSKMVTLHLWLEDLIWGQMASWVSVAASGVSCGLGTITSYISYGVWQGDSVLIRAYGSSFQWVRHLEPTERRVISLLRRTSSRGRKQG